MELDIMVNLKTLQILILKAMNEISLHEFCFNIQEKILNISHFIKILKKIIHISKVVYPEKNIQFCFNIQEKILNISHFIKILKKIIHISKVVYPEKNIHISKIVYPSMCRTP
jgi:hypothetical protein